MYQLPKHTVEHLRVHRRACDRIRILPNNETDYQVHRAIYVCHQRIPPDLLHIWPVLYCLACDPKAATQHNGDCQFRLEYAVVLVLVASYLSDELDLSNAPTSVLFGVLSHSSPRVQAIRCGSVSLLVCCALNVLAEFSEWSLHQSLVHI